MRLSEIQDHKFKGEDWIAKYTGTRFGINGDVRLLGALRMSDGNTVEIESGRQNSVIFSPGKYWSNPTRIPFEKPPFNIYLKDPVNVSFKGLDLSTDDLRQIKTWLHGSITDLSIEGFESGSPTAKIGDFEPDFFDDVLQWTHIQAWESMIGRFSSLFIKPKTCVLMFGPDQVLNTERFEDDIHVRLINRHTAKESNFIFSTIFDLQEWMIENGFENHA